MRARGSYGLVLVFILAWTAWTTSTDETSWVERYPKEAAAAKQACDANQFDSCREHLTLLLDLLNGRVDIVYRLAKLEASSGNSTAAVEWLSRFSRMGVPLADPEKDPSFAGIRSNPEYAAAISRLKAARQPVSASRVFLAIPEKDIVAEDIAYDPADNRFLVSSVRHHKILAVSQDGKVSDFLAEGAADIWGVQSLGVDSRRGYLWATTTAMPEAASLPADRGRSAVLKYSLKTGVLIKRYDLPRDAEHALGDMTLSPGGDVFVSDGHGPVYWIEQGADDLRVLVPSGVFRSPQTPALSADGRTLLIPDYSRGISLVDLMTRQTRLMPHPKDLTLAGIDGLYRIGHRLIGIQNGTSPARVIRMNLNDSDSEIVSWETLEANWDGLGVPTHGVMAGGHFYFIANSGWDRLADDGSLKPGVVFESPVIRELK